MQTQQAPRMTQPHRQKSIRARQAFTLIEILVAVTIIALLMGLLTPAVMNAVRTANTGALRVETTSLAQAIESYNLKYGEYPPDFSNWNVVERHYRKLFPRIAESEISLLRHYLFNGTTTFDPTRIDRAEALVFALGGYGSDPVRPLTNGGPFELVGTDAADSSHYQYNPQRENPVYDFDAARLTLSSIDGSSALSTTNRYVSTDETNFGASGTADLIPSYRINDQQTSYVYFDSKTYRYNTAFGFNGYATTNNGGVRPYVANEPIPRPASAGNFSSAEEALLSWKFVNAGTFQLVCAGLDDQFGVVPNDPAATSSPLYFIYPTGQVISLADATTVSQPGELLNNYPSATGYQDSSIWSTSVNAQLDNVTNFASTTLLSDVE